MQAIRALAPRVLGLTLDEVRDDMAGFWRRVTGDSQLRWLGPEKGVIHLATAALVNAVWDLWCRAEGKPLWRLLSDLSPAELVACVDFRYLTDALTPGEARELLEERAPGRAARGRWRWRPTASRPTRPRRAGSATPTTRCGA